MVKDQGLSSTGKAKKQEIVRLGLFRAHKGVTFNNFYIKYRCIDQPVIVNFEVKV